VNNTLADQGEAVFNRPTASGGCVDCHGIKPGTTRPIDEKTWATPVINVGTDTHEYDILARMAQTGVLKGVSTLADSTPLKPEDAAINILGIALTGSIEQFCLEHPNDCGSQALESSPSEGGLTDMFKVGGPGAATGAYESRVLEGIWAAAPYLHNGSVPTLAQLLTPAAQRVQTFAVGPEYDQVNIGLAPTQTQFGYTFQATGCDDLDSGNSNCGHEYGTTLSESDKAALLEYLKTL
jgi:cytochrome c peroxidase